MAGELPQTDSVTGVLGKEPDSFWFTGYNVIISFIPNTHAPQAYLGGTGTTSQDEASILLDEKQYIIILNFKLNNRRF